MANSKSIINWYYEQEFDRPSLDFDDHLADAIEQSLDKTRMDAERYARNNTNQLWDDLRKKIEEDKSRGLYPTFSEVTADLKRLFWYPNYFPPQVSKKDRQKRLRIRSRIHILKAIQALDSMQYEALSVLACKLSGASNYSLTPRTGEYGVDFFAVIPSVGKSHLFNGGTGPIRIVGQSKMHINNRVSLGTIQQFATTLNMILQRSEYVKELIPNWFSRQRGPIIGWIVAHNGLQSGAKDYANNFGILHSDSRDIAEIITMSRAWQTSDDVFTPVKLMDREIDILLNQEQSP